MFDSVWATSCTATNCVTTDALNMILAGAFDSISAAIGHVSTLKLVRHQVADFV